MFDLEIRGNYKELGNGTFRTPLKSAVILDLS
jgi:hypothetical protein